MIVNIFYKNLPDASVAKLYYFTSWLMLPPIFGRKSSCYNNWWMCDRSAESLKFSRFAFHLKSLSVFILECVFLNQTFHRVFLIGTNCGLWFRLIEDFKVLWVFLILQQKRGSNFWFSSAILLSSHTVIVDKFNRNLWIGARRIGRTRYNFSLFVHFYFHQIGPTEKTFFPFTILSRNILENDLLET